MSKTCLILPVLSCALAGLPAASAVAADRDRDGLRDRWERRYDISTTKKSGRKDPDRDKLKNRREFKLRTHPRKADTDGDGLRDGAEVRRHRTNPRRRDTDKDGFSDRAEIRAGTNPRDPASHPGAAPPPAPPAPPAPDPSRGGAGDVGPHAPNLRCDRSASTSSFSSQVSAASAGQTICLAAGDYGTWSGTSKAITVGPAPGAAATMRFDFAGGDGGFTVNGVTSPGGRIADGARDITIRNTVFRGPLTMSGLANANILLDHNSHNDINGNQADARIHLSWTSQTHSGVTISNSLIVGGDSDGVQSGVGVNVINNEFRDVKEGSSGNHTDNIQLLEAPGAVIRGNWVHLTARATSQGIAAYDGLQRALIENNVVDITRGAGIEVYSDNGSTVRHNTLVYGAPGCYGGSTCGTIDINRKSQDDAGTGTAVVDNVATSITVTNGSSVARRSNNLLRSNAGPGDRIGAPVFVGGAKPAGWAGFALAAGSSGKAFATDGLDAGIVP